MRTTPAVNDKHWVLSDEGGKLVRVIPGKSGSLWLQRFTAGMKYRMGIIWKPNKDLSTERIIDTVRRAERLRAKEPNEMIKHRWAAFVAYIAVTYVISVRGSEVFLLDLGALRKLRERATEDYFWLSLLGQLEGEKIEKRS